MPLDNQRSEQAFCLGLLTVFVAGMVAVCWFGIVTGKAIVAGWR